jgi:UDP-2,4-diacetamido-2,4,6-trideoxy-beta-L-altropyranose hydrolase
MAATRVLVFPDSGPRIGGGHAMRCLTLARALTARGAACAFAATASTQAILQAFGAPDIEVLPVSGEPDEAAAMAADRAASWGADWVLLDHYGLSPAQEAALRAGRRLAVLADLPGRPRAADLAVDSAYGRAPEAYRPLLPPGAVILTGPAYAPVRPEFAARRAAALARRREGGHLRHVLIALGLTDVDGITQRVVGTLRPMLGDLILDVVVGSGAGSLAGLCAAAKTDPHLRLHVDSHAMAELMATADIAVGAGGSSTWERATLGLPTATVVLAENQRPMAQAMKAGGLTLTADVADRDFEDQLIAALHRLIGDAALRRAMSEAAAAACDGLGAERVAEAMLAPN